MATHLRVKRLISSPLIHKALLIGLLFGISLPVPAAINQPLEADLIAIADKDKLHMSVDDISRLAEQGDAQAQLNLAIMYSSGDVLIQDNSKYFGWIKAAAEQGHTEAQFLLAQAYASGTGVAKNDIAASEWYLQAAQEGHLKAQK